VGRPPSRYCLRGHDTHEFGRNKSHGCKECDRLRQTNSLTPIVQQRLPFDPLDAVMQQKGLSYNSFGVAGSRSIARYKHNGLTWEAADEWACKLGYHPLEIWGQNWFAVGGLDG
jgi:hypothetical protein